MRIIFTKTKTTKITLEEAIKHAKEKSKELGKCACGCEHQQLAEWLEELKSFKDKFWGAGRANKKDFTEKDADPKELSMGINVEKEHTTDPEIAKRISLDHLAEGDSKYYTHLKEMEERYT